MATGPASLIESLFRRNGFDYESQKSQSAERDSVEVFLGMQTPANPGEALKALRLQRGWTLAEVGRRTGLTVSVLSKVENGRLALTFEKLVRISQGLEIDIAQLFGSPPAADGPSKSGGQRRSVTRSGDGQSIDLDRGRYLYVAAELVNKRMVPIIGEVRTKSLADYDELLRHSGEEYVFVIEGTLELHTEAYTPVRLEPGDSVYFDSSMGHAYVAVGEEPCRILSVCATSEDNLAQVLQPVAPKIRRGAKSETKLSP